jgi:hypothetical protein
MWRISWNVSNSFAKTLNQLSFGNWRNKHCTWTHTNLQTSLMMIEIKDLATPYIFPTLHNVFIIPSLCNDMVILLSTNMLSFICVFYICKYGPFFLHKKQNVQCEKNLPVRSICFS